MDSFILNIPYKWNHRIYDLLQLAYFTLHNILKVYPCSIIEYMTFYMLLILLCIIFWKFIHVLSCISAPFLQSLWLNNVPLMYIPLFVYPITQLCMSRLFPPFGHCECCYSGYVCTYIFSSELHIFNHSLEFYLSNINIEFFRYTCIYSHFITLTILKYIGQLC